VLFNQNDTNEDSQTQPFIVSKMLPINVRFTFRLPNVPSSGENTRMCTKEGNIIMKEISVLRI
jgi:hypothetical protein